MFLHYNYVNNTVKVCFTQAEQTQRYTGLTARAPYSLIGQVHSPAEALAAAHTEPPYHWITFECKCPSLTTFPLCRLLATKSSKFCDWHTGEFFWAKIGHLYLILLYFQKSQQPCPYITAVGIWAPQILKFQENRDSEEWGQRAQRECVRSRHLATTS